MPQVIDYELVSEQAARQRFECLYPNSGAFSMPLNVPELMVGWAHTHDATIREEMRVNLQIVPPETPLADLLIQAWQRLLPGRMWVMPLAHWAHELRFACRSWLPGVLDGLKVDAGMLESRADAAALEFDNAGIADANRLAASLLAQLSESDFAVMFPGWSAVAVLHHHGQIWWRTSDQELAEALRALA